VGQNEAAGGADAACVGAHSGSYTEDVAPRASPGATDLIWSALPEEKFDHVETVLSGPNAITAFDEKLLKLGRKPEGAPASRKKASALASGMKNA
jgi:hypothetical protein